MNSAEVAGIATPGQAFSNNVAAARDSTASNGKVRPGMRVLSREEGFPELPLHELRLMQAPGELSEAGEVLVRLIVDGFVL